MQHRRFGPLDVEVPVVGLGTWSMERADPESVHDAIRAAIDRGMTHIDTAEIYGDGAVEELVGESIAGYRGDVFLASKVHPDHATYAGTLLACEKSLRRLRTDRLDLYMLHWRGTQPLEPTLRAMAELKKDGKIRAFGVSNFDVPDLEEAIAIAGERQIACNQVLYNLFERDAEHVLQHFCKRREIAFVAYAPLGAERFPEPGTWSGDVLARIGEEHGTGARAIALAFAIRQPGTFAIPKTANPEHVAELAQAADIVLRPEDLEAIEGAFPLGPPRSKLPYA